MLIEDEDEFYQAAVHHVEVRRDFRDYIATVAAEEVAKLTLGMMLSEAEQRRLLETAMEPFDRAFVGYGKRFSRETANYPFSTYYRWWARQYAAKAMQDG